MAIVFLSACSGGAFNETLFSDAMVLEKGVVDAAQVESSVEGASSDATPPGAEPFDGVSSIDGDGAKESGTEAGLADAGVACSCAVLCSPGHSLRVCESCRTETCPGWDGGWPE